MDEELDPIITNAMLRDRDQARIAELEAENRRFSVALKQALDEYHRVVTLSKELLAQRDALRALLLEVEPGIDDYWRTTETGKVIMARLSAAKEE